MKKILAVVFLFGSVLTAGAWSTPLMAETETPTEETPIVETVDEQDTTVTEGTDETTDGEELTDEEVEQYINDAIALGLSLWDKIVAIASITSVSGMLTAFFVISRKLKWFDKDKEENARKAEAMESAMKEMIKEERDMKKAFIAMLTVANVDSYTKGELQKLLSDKEITMADFTEMANNLAQEKEKSTDAEESDTLLDNLTKE